MKPGRPDPRSPIRRAPRGNSRVEEARGGPSPLPPRDPRPVRRRTVLLAVQPPKEAPRLVDEPGPTGVSAQSDRQSQGARSRPAVRPSVGSRRLIQINADRSALSDGRFTSRARDSRRTGWQATSPSLQIARMRAAASPSASPGSSWSLRSSSPYPAGAPQWRPRSPGRWTRRWICCWCARSGRPARRSLRSPLSSTGPGPRPWSTKTCGA
jgi:hypothetical protein